MERRRRHAAGDVGLVGLQQRHVDEKVVGRQTRRPTRKRTRRMHQNKVLVSEQAKA